MNIPLKYNIRNLLVRRLSTGMTLFGVAMVVFIFVGLMALYHGIESSISTTGSRDNIFIMRKGAITAEVSALDMGIVNTIKYLPSIQTTPAGEPLVSPEFFTPVWLPVRGRDEEKLIAVTGIKEIALKVHNGIKIIKGNFPTGSQVMIGRLVADELGDIEIGNKLYFGRREWTVSGIFESGGTSFESGIFAPLNDIMSDMKKGYISSITAKIKEPEKINEVCTEMQEDPQLNVSVQPEIEYYKTISQAISHIKTLGYLIAILMAIGAFFGGMNTLYTSINYRKRDIGTLKALGFSQGSILMSFVVESLIISLTGGVIGSLLGLLTNGISTYMIGIVFRFKVTPTIIFQGMLFAVIIGIFGGLIPARGGVKVPTVTALRG